MKYLLIILLFPLALSAQNTYHVKTGGSDAADGLTDATAWATVNKVNTFTYPTGTHTIAFNGGDTWNEALAPTNTRIGKVTSYGTGEATLTGFKTAATWTLIGSGIYRTQLAAGTPFNMNMLMMDGVLIEKARTPNAGSYYWFQSYSGDSVIISNQISGIPSMIGAKAVTRKTGYRETRDSVVAQTSTSFKYKPTGSFNQYNGVVPAFTPGHSNLAFFFQDAYSCIDLAGEWYYDPATRYLYMKFGVEGPGAHTIKYAGINTIINAGSRGNLTIDNLNLTGGNRTLFEVGNSSNITVQNSTLQYSGAVGIFVWNTSNVNILNNTIDQCLMTGINAQGRTKSGLLVYGTTVTNTGPFHGHAAYNDNGEMKAIYTVATNSIIRRNVVDMSGYVGIEYGADNVIVDSNYLKNTMRFKTDGGALYTFNRSGSTANFNRLVNNNIVENVITAPFPMDSFPHSEIGYADGGAEGITFRNNTGKNAMNRGFYGNGNKDVTVIDNIFFGIRDNGWSQNKQVQDSIKRFVFKRNVMYSTANQVDNLTHANLKVLSGGPPNGTDIYDATSKMGTVDSNYYNGFAQFGWQYSNTGTDGPFFVKNKSLSFWQTNTGLDQHSVSLGSGYQLYFNATTTPDTLTFANARIDHLRNIYNGVMVVEPFESILAKDTTVTSILTPPTLIAASGATVDNPIVITFTDNASWRGTNPVLTIAGTTLSPSAYAITPGQITLTPSASALLQTAGSKSIAAIATGYTTAFLSQSITAGMATQLAANVQPAGPVVNGGLLTAQPVINVLDQYNNNVTTSTASITAAANVDAGPWTLGGTATVNAISGTATFSGLTATSTTATGASIDFTSSGLTGVTSAAFTIPAPVTPRPQPTKVIIRVNKRI